MTMSNNIGISGGGGVMGGQFGDTTLTKVFVGGLAWETPKEVMKEHFDKYGEILEAVIISDKLSGRSKGYGFVTFKDPEAAKKACEDATPVINGRRANCNLASLGARRPRSLSTNAPSAQQGGAVHNVGPRSVAAAAPAGNHVQWYYPAPAAAAAGTPASPFHQPQHHHHHQAAAAVPNYYGYSPAAYIATTDHVNYNHKLSYTGGSYMNGHYSPVYLGQPMVGANTLMPMYPLYYHQSHTMGLPVHFYSPGASGPITTGPTLVTKPTSVPPPNSVCLAVE